MLRRVPRLLAVLAISLGCKGKAAPESGPPPANVAVAPAPAKSAPVPGTVDPKAGSGSSATPPVIHGDKWQDPEAGGRAFTAFKETWVYVDGVAKGVLLAPELPVTMPRAWKDDVESLDFKPGDPGPHTRKIQTLRWRLADYLKIIGVDLKKVKVVYIHGNGYVRITGDQLRKFADGITFDLTGNDMSKTRFYWPAAMKTNTSYDRYAAVSVFIDKPELELDRHNNPFIDGVEVNGIPYHGTPERGGFRVYVDDQLAMVIKRNELGAQGRTNPDDKAGEPRWSMQKLLEARGLKVEPVAADYVISQTLTMQKRKRLDETQVKDLTFTAPSNSSAGIVLGTDQLTGGCAIRLYTKGHVPPDRPLPPFERVYDPKNKD
jgi:hypothetical protein